MPVSVDMILKLITFFLVLINFTSVDASINGGNSCAACTIIISLAEQLAEINNETEVEGLQRLCSYLPERYNDVCKDFYSIAAPVIQALVFKDLFTPDVACHELNFCYTEPERQECHLYPKPPLGITGSVRKAFMRRSKGVKSQQKSLTDYEICDIIPGLREICDYIEGSIAEHLPVVDIDQDKFSTIETLRGSHFRGRDCNDVEEDIHPGARPIDLDKKVDSNCNGIFGVDKETGRAYEELFCGETDPIGVALLGDSAGAHFAIPRDWFSAVQINAGVFASVPMIVADEIDWPYTSAITGYKNSSLKRWPTDSVYLRIRERNLCIHRDYQNLGVNGVDSEGMNNSVQYSMSRNRSTDYPLLVMYSLLGNDVCNGHEDTIAHMTTEGEMRANFLSTLQYLDTVLPAGSLLFVTGLADGRILYDTLHDHIHPLGDWRKDITYTDVYEYLSCLQISPCNGWMTKNETLRNFTSERAANLSRVLEVAVAEANPKNFRAHYIEYDIGGVMKRWVARGGKASDLIEPVDGFHPSQVAMYLTADYFWDLIEKLEPLRFPNNPNNSAIRKIFGDQGGY